MLRRNSCSLHDRLLEYWSHLAERWPFRVWFCSIPNSICVVAKLSECLGDKPIPSAQISSATICLRRNGGDGIEDDQGEYEEGAGDLIGVTITKSFEVVATVNVMSLGRSTRKALDDGKLPSCVEPR